MSIRNVKIKPLRKVSTFRKTAIGTWKPPRNPEIYGTVEVDLTNANEWRAKHGGDARISVLHMVARAIALSMEKYPDLNGLIRFRKIYLRESIDIFFQVATELEAGRQDLTGVRITDVNHKSVHQLAQEMADKVGRTRTEKDTALQKTARMLKAIPGFLLGIVMSVVAFISYNLNLRFPGIPPDSFGGCMISNVGSLGLDVAFAPLVPYSRVPLLILLGQAKQRPVVIDGQIEIREIVTLNATIDHRFCDGALLAKMVRVIQEVFADPDAYFGEPEAAEAAAQGPAESK